MGRYECYSTLECSDLFKKNLTLNLKIVTWNLVGDKKNLVNFLKFFYLNILQATVCPLLVKAFNNVTVMKFLSLIIRYYSKCLVTFNPFGTTIGEKRFFARKNAVFCVLQIYF